MSIIGPNNFSNKSELSQDNSIKTIANHLNMNNKKIINLSDPVSNQDASTKLYCDTMSLLVESNCLLINGTTMMEANLNVNNNKIINLSDPSNNQDAATKNYVDSKFNILLQQIKQLESIN